VRRPEAQDWSFETAFSPWKMTEHVDTGVSTTISPHNAAHHRRTTLDEVTKREVVFGSQFLLGLTIAGLASSLLSTVFGLFHVDVFLRVYKLPLATYSVGSVIFSVINTANDVLGAWLVDSTATWMNRSDLIGISGCIFAACFLTPFFRPWRREHNSDPDTTGESTLWDGTHFILSMSLYDTMYSVTSILMGSVVTDNHQMTDRDRVWFMASGKVVNLIASFLVARLGLALFENDEAETDAEENDAVNDLRTFHVFILLLAILVAALFMLGQFLMRHYVSISQWRKCLFRVVDMRKRDDNGATFFKASANRNRLQLRQVVNDFWSHPNFWAWIGMELLLESQSSFVNSFLKTFVDRLLHDGGMVPRETCDWLLSISRPLGLICGILCYIPIRRYSYQNVYPLLFAANFILSLYMLVAASHTSTTAIIVFLVIYPSITGAVLSSGFHLAQSDMVLEMKRMHALDGRHLEPSMAGLFMGANALLCKPAEAFLPVVAAKLLGDLETESPDDESAAEHVQMTLYKLLILPPLFFSILQWVSWSRYNLTPAKTHTMREELHNLHSKGDGSMNGNTTP
jgi:Na+/melibiose symporter-like transporter